MDNEQTEHMLGYVAKILVELKKLRAAVEAGTQKTAPSGGTGTIRGVNATVTILDAPVAWKSGGGARYWAQIAPDNAGGASRKGSFMMRGEGSLRYSQGDVVLATGELKTEVRDGQERITFWANDAKLAESDNDGGEDDTETASADMSAETEDVPF